MKLSRTLTIAYKALSRNFMRAILTTLGIIIGIAAVIVMMEIGQGSSKAIQNTISAMGANTLVIQPGTAASGGVSYGAGSITTLTAEDSAAILKECPSVKNAAPIVRTRSQVIYGNHNWVPQYINGSTPAFLEVRDWTNLEEGETFSEQDLRNGSKVCILGKTLVRELFQGESPIGKELRIQNISFKVIGVLRSKGANMMGMDQDDILIAPWTTIKFRVSNSSSSTSSSSTSKSSDTSSNKLYPNNDTQLYPEASVDNLFLSKRLANVDQILISARSAEDVQSAINEVTALLHERHHIREGEVDDFSVRDMTEITKTLTSTSDLMTRLLLGVALISLVVGGVGIMNIMLVSVTERTREIGLRMAVGAKAKDILQQFLVEAIMLCLSGGVVGIILGLTISHLITLLLKWPTESSLPTVIAAFSVSVTVGLIFGYYPAWKASKLDPIEALRYE